MTSLWPFQIEMHRLYTSLTGRRCSSTSDYNSNELSLTFTLQSNGSQNLFLDSRFFRLDILNRDEASRRGHSKTFIYSLSNSLNTVALLCSVSFAENNIVTLPFFASLLILSKISDFSSSSLAYLLLNSSYFFGS